MAVAEVSRLENLIGLPTTPISDVNRNAGIKPIKVPQVFDLVQRSIKISEFFWCF
jgi:thiamine biosynthesis lipoprotein